MQKCAGYRRRRGVGRQVHLENTLPGLRGDSPRERAVDSGDVGRARCVGGSARRGDGGAANAKHLEIIPRGADVERIDRIGLKDERSLEREC